ncbi:MAG: DUF465 domain-containing protein [Desulfovibrionaceae bacterium]|nr:DUF465 domain-containing protein [Desulfovibrionaceae bacterium]
MEQQELLLLEKYAKENAELKDLWDSHILYEKQIESLEGKAYRTPSEESSLKQLKKQKLDGKTRMHAILDEYKKSEAGK